MTQEEKQLLLKDLCSRLPYGIKCCARYNTGSRYNTNIVTIIPENGSIVTRQNELHYQQSSLIEDCRPYLRPMSSMTEEEKKELKSATCPEGTGYFDEQYLICPMSHFGEHISYSFMSDILNWLNAHHFDYRGLIEKGLALEAPKDMYKTE